MRIIDIAVALGISSGMLSDAFGQEAMMCTTKPYSECLSNTMKDVIGQSDHGEVGEVMTKAQEVCTALQDIMNETETSARRLLSMGEAMTEGDHADLEALYDLQSEILETASGYRNTAPDFFREVPDNFCDVKLPLTIVDSTFGSNTPS